MISFWRIFSLELKSLWRTKTLPILLIVSALWMLFSPFILKGDGSTEGFREVYIRFSFGGVFAATLITLVFAATAAIARERKFKRLQLTMVRPVRYSIIALSKTFALTSAGFINLALSATLSVFHVDFSRQAKHILLPESGEVEQEAEKEYAFYMGDERTPAVVKASPKADVIRVLKRDIANRIAEIKTGESLSLIFDIPESHETEEIAARIRFSNMFDMKCEVLGKLVLDGHEAEVKHSSEAALVLPLVNLKGESAERLSGEKKLVFTNTGKQSVLLRKYREVQLLSPAGGFAGNLIRSVLELTGILAFVVSLSVFLAAAMSRPVATFTALVLLLLSEMSPAVTYRCYDDLLADSVERFGAKLNHIAEGITAPLTARNPIESLSNDTCVEPEEVKETMLIDLVLLPCVFSMLSAFAFIFKKEE